MLRDLQELPGGIDAFDVDAYCAAAMHGDEDGVARVGDVEGDVGVDELGLSAGRGGDGN